MKILVTGATGFLGHHLVKKLVQEGYDVRILKDKSSPMDLIKDFKLEAIVGDIRDFESVKKAVLGCDIVFHLAGIISYWNRQNNLQFEVNVNGIKNVLKSCLESKVKKLIYTSSTVAVGFNPGGLADEKTEFNLGNLGMAYCDTKYLAEKEVQKAVKEGLNAVIVCPGSIYGSGDIRRIKEDPVFPKGIFSLFYVDGGLGVVDVEDVVEGEILAWKKGKKGERYILVGENLSFYEIRKTVAEILKKNPPKIKMPSFLFLALSYLFNWISYLTGERPKFTPENGRLNKIFLYYSNEKAKKELGMKFKPFRESAQRMIDWYKEKGYI